MTTRVFGGQTVGQGYFAFKKLFPESTVVKIDTNFIAAGNANEIIDYFIDLNSINFGFTKVTAKQKEKIIAYCNIRFTLKENIKDIVLIKNLDSDFPYGIDEPHNYRKLVEADAKGMVGKMGTDKAIFEIRPIDPGRFLFYEDSFEIAPSWIKVNPDFAGLNFIIQKSNDCIIFRSQILRSSSSSSDNDRLFHLPSIHLYLQSL